MKNLQILKLLVGIGALLTFLSWLFEKSEWLSSALLNIGSGIVTSVVFIYAYDLLIERQQEKLRKEKQRRAISNQKITLRQHYRVLLDCYRSAYAGAEPAEFKDVNSFLGTRYEETFASLNIYAPSPANSMGTTPYYKYIEDSFIQVSSSLDSMLAASGENLDQDLFVAVDNLLNSEFMRACQSLSAIFTFTVPGFGNVPSQLITGMVNQIQDYCIKFCQLINAFEKIEPQGLREYRKEDWQNLIFPIGHARVASA